MDPPAMRDDAPIVVREIVDDVMASVASTFPDADVDVTISIPPDTSVAADEAAVHLVFLNVLSNAVRFSPAGERVVVTGRTDGDLVTVSIANVAPPLTKEQREELFRPFIRIDDTTGNADTSGGGRGLQLVRRFTELYGGTVSVASRGGTITFTLQMPAATTPERIVDLREKKADLELE